MKTLFIGILNLSIASVWLILAVLVLRFVLKRVAPRWTVCLLWGLVAISLAVPFSFESSLSLVPSRQSVVYSEGKTETKEQSALDPPQTEQAPTEKPSTPVTTPSVPVPRPQAPVISTKPNVQVQSGITGVDDRINQAITKPYATEKDSETLGNKLVNYGSNIWLVGTVAMLSYFAVSLFLLKRSLSTSVATERGVYQSERVKSPFVLGFLKPKVYLPFGLSADTQSYVLRHEHAHIKRFDHLVKPLAFLVLAIHWFNPLVWVAYILLCRDIEYACDEKVIRDMGSEQRKEYAAALLACGVKGSRTVACPVAFGEISVKQRILKTLNYKKPAFWIIIAVIVAAAVLALCFLSTPEKKGEDGIEESFEVSTEEENAEESGDKDLFLGTWRCDDTAGFTDISFKLDGTGSITTKDGKQEFEWHRHDETNDKKLYINGVELPFKTEFGGVDYTVEGDVFTIHSASGEFTCTKVTEKQAGLVGTWYAADHSIMIKEDGTGVYHKDGVLSPISWSVSGNSLTVSTGSEKWVADFTVSADGLNWGGAVYSTTFSGQSNSRHDSALVGTWYSYDTYTGENCYVFEGDGTGYVSTFGVNMAVKWHTEESTLYYTPDMENVGFDATMKYTYRVDGDTLVLEIYGEEQTFTKTRKPLGGDLALVGEWFDVDATPADDDVNYSYKISFNVNGTGDYQTDEERVCSFIWMVNEDIICLETSNGNTVDISYTLHDGVLTLNYGDESGAFMLIGSSEPTIELPDELGGDDALAGAWFVGDEDTSFEFNLNADGTGEIGVMTIGTDICWYVEDGVLYIYIDSLGEFLICAPYVIVDDYLYICDNDTMLCLTRKDSGFIPYIVYISSLDTEAEANAAEVDCDFGGTEYIVIATRADLTNFRFAKTYGSFRGDPCEINGTPYEHGTLFAEDMFVAKTVMGELVSDHCILFTDPNGKEQCLKIWYYFDAEGSLDSDPGSRYSFEYVIQD